MADIIIPQGMQTPIDFVATDFGVIDFFQVEIRKNNNAVLKYRYPTTTGFQSMTKNGDVYTAVILTSDSNNLLGLYGAETTGFVGTAEVGKAINNDYLLVNQQSL